jgi:hypothetical protein
MAHSRARLPSGVITYVQWSLRYYVPAMVVEFIASVERPRSEGEEQC